MTRVAAKMAGNTRSALLLYACFRGMLVALGRTWNRMSVEGRGNVPATGPFVLAPVHRSNVDTPYVAVATARRMRYMGKDSLWKNPVSAWLLSALGGFPVSRGSADREALMRALQVLQAGEPIVVFPEGSRQYGPLVQPLFEGAAYLATKVQCPIVPVGIGGSERVQRKGSVMIWPRKVHVRIGEPISPPPLVNGRLPRPEVTALTARLHDELQVLFDAAQVRAGA